MKGSRDRARVADALVKVGFVLAVTGLVVVLGVRTAPGTQATPRTEARINYPPGAWHVGEVSPVVLGVAHILVAHASSSAKADGLYVPAPRASRTRAEALAIALDVAERARRAPDSFADLARRFSDDRTTSARGGRFGAIHVIELPERMLDALQDLKPGEVSRVVETDLGFHVVRRLELPRDQSVQGQEIVVSYRGIPTKARADRAASAEVRELDAARALAEGLLERTRAGADFAALAREFSDASSAEAGGDIGWHSIYEARIEVTFDTLAELQPGQISDLIDDGLDGFRILKRTNVGSPTVAEAAAKEPHEFEMPAPPVPDELNSSVAQLVWYIENFKAEASARFTFTDGEALAFASILEEFAEDVRRSSEPARRTQALSKLHEQLTVAFGAKEAAELIGFERNHRASLLGMNY